MGAGRSHVPPPCFSQETGKASQDRSKPHRFAMICHGFPHLAYAITTLQRGADARTRAETQEYR